MGCLTNIGSYGIKGSDSDEAASSVHTAPGSLGPSSIVALLLSHSQMALPSRPKMDYLEARLWAIKEELLASQAKSNGI